MNALKSSSRTKVSGHPIYLTCIINWDTSQTLEVFVLPSYTCSYPQFGFFIQYTTDQCTQGQGNLNSKKKKIIGLFSQWRLLGSSNTLLLVIKIFFSSLFRLISHRPVYHVFRVEGSLAILNIGIQ